MARMLSDGRRKLHFVPTLANHREPTVAELTGSGSLSIECLISAANFTLGSTGEDAVSDPAFCSTSNDQTPGRITYEAGFNFFRGTTPQDDIAWETFAQAGIEGYLVQRMGQPHDEDFAAGDKVQVYKVITGSPMIQTPESGSSEKFRNMFYVQGEGTDERAVVA